ncbi:hypothetical protein QAD02_021130 [Eretmocerus hayati]|uniref:Uncharacterized protein n=1 Tax=Eretmocerus hayati TaxID=131215 RepID=A0ACC2PPM0_9HYME|nr:hypothetical protein QAD02_021130 [Eretmocerus hayati]
MSKVSCRTDPNRFCYVCGSLTFKREVRNLSDTVISLYYAYFKKDVSGLDGRYVPCGVCNTCYMTLRLWSKCDRKSMPIAIPMIWCRPMNHPEDCYFCQCDTYGFNRSYRRQIKYPKFTSAQRPLPHDCNVPVPPSPWILQDDSCEDQDSGIDSIDFTDPTVELPGETTVGPTLFNQKRLNDPIHDLSLTREEAQLLGSCLQEMNLLLPGTTFSQYRHREEDFTPFFAKKDSWVYCENIPGAMSTAEVAATITLFLL